MSKPTLALKSTVTRQTPAVETVDAAERIKQSEHHQAAVQAANAAATAAQAELAVSKLGSIRTRYKAHSWPSAWVNRLLSILANGVRLSGRLRQFDQYCLLIESESQQQLIFKHAVSTVMAATR